MMATVNGITVARAQEIEDAAVVTGSIDGNGNLILTTGDGTLINAGLVENPTLLNNHMTDTSTHGVGVVVGTTETQTLSGKTLTTPTIANFTNAQHDHGDADDGGALLVGTTVTSSTYTSRSVSSGTPGPLSMASISVPVGTWMIMAQIRGWIADAGLSTRVEFNLSSTGGTLQEGGGVTQDSSNGAVSSGVMQIGTLVNSTGANVTVNHNVLYLAGNLAITNAQGLLLAVRIA
jgi:hypothetical protein